MSLFVSLADYTSGDVRDVGAYVLEQVGVCENMRASHEASSSKSRRTSAQVTELCRFVARRYLSRDDRSLAQQTWVELTAHRHPHCLRCQQVLDVCVCTQTPSRLLVCVGISQ